MPLDDKYVFRIQILGFGYWAQTRYLILRSVDNQTVSAQISFLQGGHIQTTYRDWVQADPQARTWVRRKSRQDSP